MPESVKCSFWHIHSQPFAQVLQVSQDISTPETVPVSSSEHRTMLRLLLKPVQVASEFQAEWNCSAFVTFALDRYQQIVKVHIFPTQTQQFTDASSSVSQCQQQALQPLLAVVFWFVGNEDSDVFGRIRRDNLLRFFQLWNLEGRSAPLQVSVDRTKTAVNAGGLQPASLMFMTIAFKSHSVGCSTVSHFNDCSCHSIVLGETLLR